MRSRRAYGLPVMPADMRAFFAFYGFHHVLTALINAGRLEHQDMAGFVPAARSRREKEVK